MNDHVPRSTGFPLRATIMLLLFLGVIFLLVAIQTLRTSSSSSDDEDPAIPTVVATSLVSPTEEPEPPRPDIRIYNISDQDGLAGITADKLREANFIITEIGNLELPEINETTVYYTDAPGEQETAEEIARILEARAEPRSLEVADQPPGVVVVVAG